MKHILAILSVTTLFAGCASVSDRISTKKVETTHSSIPVQTASYDADDMPSEASMICENDEMRTKALDRDVDNDTARVMIVQDETENRRILHEIEVNCRDYFLRKSVYPSEAKVVRSSTKRYIEPEAETRQVKRRRNLTYVVQRGDTVWGIAREHCTSVKAITRLNGIGRGNHIDIGQRLELPDTECE